jgi:IclR family transcriptional regulator, acetate operon repressor
MLQDVKAAELAEPRPRTRIQSVARAIHVLRFVAERDEGPASLTEIAAEIGTPLPTAHHLVATLVDEGMLVRDPKRGYRLGTTAGALGDAFRREPAVPDALLIPLHKLSVATGENSFLSGWVEGEITLLRHQQGRFGFRIPKVTPGFTAFAHARAAGKLLLAHLPKPELRHFLDTHPLRPLTPRTIAGRRAFDRELATIRASGFAVDDEEFMDGVASVAAPVNADTKLFAYAVAAPVERFRANRERFIQAARSACRLAEAALSEDVDGGDDSTS